MEKQKTLKQKGITLIALIITIIILLILAGIAISSLTQSGLFGKAQEAKEKYEISAYKEKIQLEIESLRIDKYAKGENLTKEDLPQINSDEIDVGSTEEFPVEVIAGKYKYNVDENFVVTYVGEADETIITYTTEPTGYTNQDEVKIIVKVKNPKGIKTIEKPNSEILNVNGATEKQIEYTVTANGKYTFKVIDVQNKEVTKEIVINQIDKLAPLDFTAIISEVTYNGFTITVNASDAEADETNVKSGIEKYEYYIKTSTDTEYTKYESNKESMTFNNLLDYTEYTIYAVVYDKAGNSNEIEEIKQKTMEEQVDYEEYIDSHITVDKKIYISSEYGNDTTGDGTQDNPYATLDKIAESGIIENNYTYAIVLMNGKYNLTTKIFELNNNQSINIFGNKRNTNLLANDVLATNRGVETIGTTDYEIIINRLVFTCNDVNSYYPIAMMNNNVTFNNVVLDTTNLNGCAVFYTNTPICSSGEIKINNCIVPISSSNMISIQGSTKNIKVSNSYGGFSSGYGTTDSDWNYQTNYITSTPKVDSTTYRITDDESIWKDVGTGTDPDGSQADLGVYGGEYSWEN